MDDQQGSESVSACTEQTEFDDLQSEDKWQSEEEFYDEQEENEEELDDDIEYEAEFTKDRRLHLSRWDFKIKTLKTDLRSKNKKKLHPETTGVYRPNRCSLTETAVRLNLNVSSRSGGRMKTEREVIDWIRWDSSLKALQPHMIIGYRDRFEGVLEMKFVDWESLDKDVTGLTYIPGHRIVYFRLHDQVFWDRRSHSWDFGLLHSAE